MIVDDEIFDHICAPLPSGAKLTAVMDCCHSGTGLDLPFVWHNGQWIEEDNPCHSAGDVLLISGCLDEQTSADATGHRGEAAGALTTALCDTIEEHPPPASPGVVQLLQSTHMKLQQRGFDQIPNLTASQRFDVAGRRFSVTEGFETNMNPSLGRHFRKTKHPKVDFGGAFGEMLSSAATTAAFAPMATSLFGGHHGAPAQAPPADAHLGGFHESGAPPGLDVAQPAPLAAFGQAVDDQDDSFDSFGADSGDGGGFGFGDDDDDW